MSEATQSNAVDKAELLEYLEKLKEIVGEGGQLFTIIDALGLCIRCGDFDLNQEE